jgi:hypothetical protein
LQIKPSFAPREISARFAYGFFWMPVDAVIPFDLKVVYTLFVCALVPIYWRQYGPANFLWFSDIALLALVPALWLENALLVSMMAVSIVFFEALWNIDFFFRLATGKSLIGLSAYMFDAAIQLFIRVLSGFHIILPVLLLWMLHRLGYDQRAFLCQTIVALVVLPLSYLVSDAQENVNWVYGFGQNPQRLLPAPLFVILLMPLFPLVVYLPTHLLFIRIFRCAGS